MTRTSPSDHYRQLQSEIWDDSDEYESDHQKLMQTAIGKLGEQSETLQHAVGAMLDAVSRSVEASEAAAITAALGDLKTAVAADNAALRKTMLSIQGAMGHLAAKLDGMTAAMTAPKHVIYDDEGRPVGVRSGEPK